MKTRKIDIMENVKNRKNTNKESLESRRKFLKKTVYSAPSLIVLGNLVYPTIAGASTTIDDRDGPGGGFGGG